MIRAALYLRSSKDRKDVSIDTQRSSLTELARGRGIEVVAEFVDVVESGKDDDRPGYQGLVTAVRSRSRGWTHLLINDTARLSRRRMISMIFEEQECRRHGVTIIYRSVPEGDDPATTMILRSIMQAFDEHHSLVSRQKGLSGMAENVHKGFRAGGKAPFGYRLKPVDIGLIREGKAVTKSVLEPTEQAASLARYLQHRAKGRTRSQALAEAGLKAVKATLNGIERNALTYAGCTVWNVHNEVGHPDGRRRPRSEWVIKENTHPALISRDEAEALLAQLDSGTSALKMGADRRSLSELVLSGLLVGPTGVKWDAGGRGTYRHRLPGQPARYLPALDVEKAVIEALLKDIHDEAFVQALVDHSSRKEISDKPRKAIQQKLIALNGEIDRTVAMAARLEDPSPILRRVATLESQREQLLSEQARADLEIQEARLLAKISPAQVRSALQDLSERLDTDNRRQLKQALPDLIEKVQLDPADLSLQIHYRVAVDCRKGLAFPRGFEPLLHP